MLANTRGNKMRLIAWTILCFSLDINDVCCGDYDNIAKAKSNNDRTSIRFEELNFPQSLDGRIHTEAEAITNVEKHLGENSEDEDVNANGIPIINLNNIKVKMSKTRSKEKLPKENLINSKGPFQFRASSDNQTQFGVQGKERIVMNNFIETARKNHEICKRKCPIRARTKRCQQRVKKCMQEKGRKTNGARSISPIARFGTLSHFIDRAKLIVEYCSRKCRKGRRGRACRKEVKKCEYEMKERILESETNLDENMSKSKN